MKFFFKKIRKHLNNIFLGDSIEFFLFLWLNFLHFYYPLICQFALLYIYLWLKKTIISENLYSIEVQNNKEKILFIINPISGKGKAKNIENIILSNIDANIFDCHCVYTEYGKHAVELSKNAINQGFNTIIAVGGDGTVNEVASSLVYSNTKFGIIPLGSGNGLARFLKIPLNTKKAIKLINKNHSQKIDTIKVNDNYCINMAGVGFDAHISHLFANYGKRGLKSYVKLIIREFFKYKNQNYKLLINNELYKKSSFVISFANSTQFGNNAHIAPLAKINDGLIDICILRKFSLLAEFPLAIRLFAKNIHKSKYYELIKTDKLKIINSDILYFHIDGDPFTFNSDVKISVEHKSLNVIC